jgi:hypothetical protein
VDQSFYVVSSSTNTSAQLYTIDVSTGVRTLLVNNAGFPVTGSGTDKKVWSIAFDSSGTMWGINRTLGLFSAVVTGTNASDFASSVQIGAAVGAIDAYALFIQNAAPVPTPAPAPTAEPTLANTGTSTSEALRYASLGAALLLGGILMHSRARRIRRNK